MSGSTRGSSAAGRPLSAISFEAAGRLSLPELLDRRVVETPDARAVISVRRELTFAEWRAGAARFASVLGDAVGEVRSERVLVWLSNDEAHDYVCVLHGIFMHAGIAVALDDRLTSREARSLIAETDPVALVIGPAVAENLGPQGLAELGDGDNSRFADLVSATARSDRLAVCPVRRQSLAPTPEPWSLETGVDELGASRASASDPAVIFFSSGSTGKPKGALWGQGDWVSYAERAAHAVYALPRAGKPLEPADVLQSPIPLYTAAALMENIYSPALSGCTLAFEGARFDPARSEQRMTGLGTTIYNGAPAHFAMMCDRAHAEPPPNLELLVSGGSAFTKPLHARMRARWPGVAIANWYGLMESGVGQTLNWGEDIERAPEAIGRLLWPAEARIVDSEFRDVADGVEGELWLRAPGQIEGYRGNPEQTAARLHGGWLRTGDRAIRDRDGLYYAVGRQEDRINRGGFKFYPVEIESVLEAHAEVREAAVIGVPHSVLGEDAVAVVVRASGRSVTADQLRDHCRRHLAPNKVPARVVFADTLPRNAYGKVMRRELGETYVRRMTSG